MTAASVGTAGESWLDPITSIATAARTVAVRHPMMSTEVREEVLGMLYDRTTQLRDAAIELHARCTGDAGAFRSLRSWQQPRNDADR